MSDQLSETIENTATAIAQTTRNLADHAGATADYLTATSAAEFNLSSHMLNLLKLGQAATVAGIHMWDTALSNMEIIVSDPPNVWISEQLSLDNQADITGLYVVSFEAKPAAVAYPVGLNDDDLERTDRVAAGQGFRVLLVEPLYIPFLETINLTHDGLPPGQEIQLSVQMQIAPVLPA